MKEIIEAVQTRLAASATIKYVDENWGQLDYYSPNFPVKWPCVLIDVSQAQFSDIGRNNSQVPVNRQMGAVILELRIADVRMSNTSAKAPVMQKQYARSIHGLLEEVHASLHGWNPTATCGKLIRKSMNRVRRDDGVQEYVINYSAEINDC